MTGQKLQVCEKDKSEAVCYKIIFLVANENVTVPVP